MRPGHQFVRPAAALRAVAVALCALAYAAPVLADNVVSTQYPQIRSGNFANAPLVGVQNGGLTGALQGHVGVDMWMSSSGLNGGNPYLPCQNPSNEPFIAACAMRGAYYKVLHYCSPSSDDFPYGLFIDNTNNGVTSNWGNKTTGVAFEIYPYSKAVNGPTCDPASSSWSSAGYDLQPGGGRPVYGGLRVVANTFDNNANGGWYSPYIGLVSVPERGNPGVGLVNGYVCHSGANAPPSCPNGSNAPDHTVNFDWFGQAVVTNRSSTGYGVSSFNSWSNQSADTGSPSSDSGYYTSGPLLDGATTLFVTDHNSGRGWLCTINVQIDGERIDFNLDDNWLGHSEACAPR